MPRFSRFIRHGLTATYNNCNREAFLYFRLFYKAKCMEIGENDGSLAISIRGTYCTWIILWQRDTMLLIRFEECKHRQGLYRVGCLVMKLLLLLFLLLNSLHPSTSKPTLWRHSPLRPSLASNWSLIICRGETESFIVVCQISSNLIWQAFESAPRCELSRMAGNA